MCLHMRCAEHQSDMVLVMFVCQFCEDPSPHACLAPAPETSPNAIMLSIFLSITYVYKISFLILSTPPRAFKD